MTAKPNDSTDKPSAPELQGVNRGSEPPAYAYPKKEPSPRKLTFLSAAALAVLSIAAGFVGGWLGGDHSKDSDRNVKEQRIVLQSRGELISSIAKEVGESVVSVEVTSTVFPADRFFGFQGTTEQQSAGTGIILDENGLIITNRHVVPPAANKVSVTMSDGTKFEDVEVIGRTRSSDPLDIAFLKIKDKQGKELKAAAIGDSASMKVGDSVIAIGNALGQFQNTVTSGIISGYGRSIQAGDEDGRNAENLENLFQTDAAINQGNSGGPLVDLEGKVIGINTAVAGYAENIGFSIPINDIKSLIKSVSEKGKLERPFLGVVYIPITADLAKQYDLSRSQGVYVPPSIMVGQDAVIDGGPADKAGIRENDILIKINDESIDEKHSITALLGKYEVGDTVKVIVVRDGRERTVEVRLEAAPEQ